MANQASLNTFRFLSRHFDSFPPASPLARLIFCVKKAANLYCMAEHVFAGISHSSSIQKSLPKLLLSFSFQPANCAKYNASIEKPRQMCTPKKINPRLGASGLSVNLTLVNTNAAKLENPIAIHSSNEASRKALSSGFSKFAPATKRIKKINKMLYLRIKSNKVPFILQLHKFVQQIIIKKPIFIFFVCQQCSSIFAFVCKYLQITILDLPQ